jgi:hypothetical protein
MTSDRHIAFSRNSKRDGPVTSREAGERHERNGTASRHRDIVLAALRAHPGSTAAELGAVDGLGYHETARRLPDLARRQLAYVTGHRTCDVTGNMAQEWTVRESGGGTVATQRPAASAASSGPSQQGTLFNTEPMGWMK